MMTSNFATCGKHMNAMSIAGRSPSWYAGRRYSKLAPKLWFFAEFKRDGNSELYTARFKDEVLSELDPQETFDSLGEDAILLCYEKPGEFCHRRIVAEWFETELGIVVPEYVKPKPEIDTTFWRL